MVLSLFNHNRTYRHSESIGDYIVEKPIGEGRYGICYLVRQEKRQYVLKQLKKRMLKKSGPKARFEEEILTNLCHESIPRFIERIECKEFCGLVLEFKSGRPIDDLVYMDRQRFGKEEISRVGYELIGILKYLHSKGIVHRDIRVPNTLYDGCRISLIDFGLARWIDGKKYRADIDFAYLGDFLLHLCYSTFEPKNKRKIPWYEELELTQKELFFLKRLMGIEKRYECVSEVEYDFLGVFDRYLNPHPRLKAEERTCECCDGDVSAMIGEEVGKRGLVAQN
jgi:serine/threonine-protein kinase